MRPEFIDSMSWEMAEVYGAVTDQILINLAKYFPYYDSNTFPRSSLTYQADMLAQMGQVNKETMAIIRRNLKNADPVLQRSLEQIIIDSVEAVNPELWDAVKKGIFMPPMTPVVSANQYRAFNLYYKQAADKLNLVNTVMLESTQDAYRATVSDIANRIQATQTALDIGAGETITGASAWNTATAHAINRMKQNGITGFIDHAGRRWSAESYVAMDIRTTMFNTGRAAVWETNQNFGNDLYQVSYHNGARPLCYPWQNKVISSTDTARTVTDLDGNEIEVIAQSATSYGKAAGLFGVNCKHYPNPFIPGVSVIRGEPQDKKTNDRVYEESQQQRAYERKIREEKRDLMMLKAQGAPDDIIKEQRAKIRQTDDDIDEFCAKTGRHRRQNREGVYTERKFPSAFTYDPRLFEDKQKQLIDDYFKSGGAQQGFTFGQMTTNTAKSVNVFGETISFSEKMNEQKWDVAKQTINTLASEYNTKLKTVTVGAHHAAGDVQISGTIMRLSDTAQFNTIHEFAHSISLSDQTKFGLYDEGEFWREIRKVRTSYRKAVEGNPAAWISTYEHSSKSIDEFMAESFTLGYMREKGLKLPDKYGTDTEFSSRVLSIVKKYFGK